MSLIQTLKSQHAAVLEMVKQMDARLEREDIPGAARLLTPFRRALEAHLALEDGELYPRLIQAADEKRDATLGQTARLFASNMGHISQLLRQFLAKYEGKASLELEPFRREWRAVAEVLGSRVDQEEKMLYPLYARVDGPAAPTPPGGRDTRRDPSTVN